MTELRQCGRGREWPDEAIQILCRKWAKDWSGSEIKEYLNDKGFGPFSRSAVVGRANRLGLTKRQGPNNRTQVENDTPLAEPCTPHKSCQYPLWDTRPNGKFCGDTVARAGTPYCAKHMAACYGNPVWRA